MSMGEITSGTVRARLYAALDPRARTRGLSRLNQALIFLILTAGAIAVLETEPSLTRDFQSVFTCLETALGLVFALEYAARLWTAPEQTPDGPAWPQRLRFVVSVTGLIDLLAIFSSFLITGGSSALLLRFVRLARLLRLAKLGRMSRALDHMVEAVSSRRDELVLSLSAGLVLMIAAATALYLAEGSVQPDKFGSIPRALWWSVATMTTIGYGDVYPVTALGKCLAAAVALISIGVIAMPTGILAASFSDAMQRHRQGGSSADT